MLTAALRKVSYRTLSSSEIPALARVILPNMPLLGTQATLETMIGVDPETFVIAESDAGDIVGCIAGMKIGENRGHLGVMYVRVDYRRSGIGSTVLTHCMQRMKNLSCTGFIAKDYVKALVKNKYPVTHSPEGDVLRIRCRADFSRDNSGTLPTGFTVKCVEDGSLLEQVACYDKDLHGYDTSLLSKLGIKEPGCLTYAALDGSSVCGYVRAHPLNYGRWRIGPLYAEEEIISRLLLERVVSSVSPVDRELSFTTEVPKGNTNALKFFQSLGEAKAVCEVLQFSSNYPLPAPTNQIFAIRSTRQSES